MDWSELGEVVLSWLLSPVLAGILSFSVYLVIHKFTLEGTRRLLALYLITTVSLQTISVLLFGLLPPIDDLWLIPVLVACFVSARVLILGVSHYRVKKLSFLQNVKALFYLKAGTTTDTDLIITEVYRALMVVAACMVCLAHGSNDIANSIAPLIVIMKTESIEQTWAYLLGGSGICVGLLTLGKKTIETMGNDVTYLDFYKGFSC